jgi:acetyltransferase-like isoleucine patch superfamily enzyme
VGTVWTTPWKARNEVRRLVSVPLTRLYFAWHGIPWGSGWKIYGLPTIQRFRGSAIVIGPDLQMRNWFGANPLGVRRPCLMVTWSPSARIEIGRGVGMTGATLCAQTRVVIGDHVLLGANCAIVDTDFHPLDPEIRRRAPQAGATEPIVIEADVFVGTQALILKGVRIGRGAVVGAGSVVTGDVPARAVVAGNPARVVRMLGGETA